MKKLMIMAAAAAMAGSVLALGNAQVYDAKLTVKTTGCVKGKYTQALVNFPNSGDNEFGYAKGDTVQFRKQATRKINGVFWGCDCETIANPAWRVYTSWNNKKNPPVEKTPHTVGGYAFWDATKASNLIPFTIPYVSFEWLVLNRIDQMKSVEGTWVLRDRAADEALFLVGAGFGTCNNKASDDCDSYIKSISGNFAGFLQYAAGGDDGCVFCGTTDYNCLVAPFCWCQNVVDSTYLTAAYGTWSITYNASNSKALKKKSYITQVSAYAKKPFKSTGNDDAAHPSVYDCLNAEMIAIKTLFGLGPEASLGAWLKADWEDYVTMEDGKLITVNKKGEELVVQETKDYSAEEVFAAKDLYFDAFAELGNCEVAPDDPGLATEDEEFPANVAKYVDAS